MQPHYDCLTCFQNTAVHKNNTKQDIFLDKNERKSGCYGLT